MNTLEKDFVPYEQALELKELGFDEPCFLYWYKGSNGYILVKEKNQTFQQYILAPTFSQAFRWFREKHGFDYSIYRPFTKIKQYCWNITNREIGFEYPDKMIGEYAKTYEEAESACLDKLIEIVEGITESN